MVRLGIIGLSEGNGHPYSFSAIINGFNKKAFSQSGWDGILNYLEKRDASDFLAGDAKITHVWTQSPSISKNISESCNIEHVVKDWKDMLDEVDAVIIARDDYENHMMFAQPFLEYGTPVFVDKPLTVNVDELQFFEKYLRNGMLMSCSGLRYCRELDEWRSNIKDFGEIRLWQANVINGWEKYGIHMIDAILGVTDARPVTVEFSKIATHGSFNVGFSDGSFAQINALGPDVKTFSIGIYGTERSAFAQISDNFSAFKRTMFRFIKQVKERKPSHDVQVTIDSIKVLIAGRMSMQSKSVVRLSELGD